MKKFFIGIDISKKNFDVAVFKADDIEKKPSTSTKKEVSLVIKLTS